MSVLDLRSALLSAALWIAPSISSADTIHVPADAATIQLAMVVATDGDTILVAPGTYFGTVSFFGKSVVLKSSDGPATTILDGLASGSVVSLANGEGPGAVVEGFTIRNGTGTFDGGALVGGGVYVAPGADVIVRGNTITANSAAFGGGLYSASPIVVTDNVVSGNIGDGLYLFEVPGPVTVTDNVVESNTTSGIFAFVGGAGAEAQILRNAVTSNGGFGISARLWPSVVVRDNDVGRSQAEGFYLAYSGEVVVEGNRSFGNSGDGYFFLSCDDAVVQRNTSLENAGNGYLVWAAQEASVRDNSAVENGGVGVFARSSGVVNVADNTAYDSAGDGVYVWDCESASVTGNRAFNNGEIGVFTWLCDFVEVANNASLGNLDRGFFVWDSSAEFTGNLAAENGDAGLFIRGSDVVVSGVTCYRNAGLGLFAGKNLSVAVENSIFRENGEGEVVVVLGSAPVLDHCNVQGGYLAGTNIIDLDPLFVDSDGPDDDPATVGDNDYRLQAASPCVDAGGPSTIDCAAKDLGGSPRFNDGLLDGGLEMDMGAYEFTNVELDVTGTPVPGGALAIHVTGTPGLPTLVIANVASNEVCIPDFGVLVPDVLGAVFLVAVTPGSVGVTVPSGFTAGQEIFLQGVAVGGVAGNVSNPVRLVVQ